MNVTRQEALDFLDIATRNWPEMLPLSEDDIGDVATALLRFVTARANPSATLEWKDAALSHSYGVLVRIAQTRFGPYQILRGSQGRFEVYFGNVPFSGAMDTVEEAEAWAQTDFGDRLRSPIKAKGATDE